MRGLDHLSSGLAALCLLFACLAVVHCAHESRKPESGEEISHSRLIASQEKKLLEAMLQYLATSPTADPRTYTKRKQVFGSTLARYLRLVGNQKQIILRTHREGMSFIFPLQIINAGDLTTMLTTKDSVAVLGEVVGPALNGEVLDLAWLPSEDPAGRVLALFADSLVSFNWPPTDGPSDSVFHFLQENHAPVRSAFPSGLLSLHDFNGDGSLEVACMTSNLKSPEIFQPEGASLKRIAYADSLSDSTAARARSSMSGRDIFKADSSLPAFRTLRTLQDSQHVALIDEGGHVNVLSAATSEVVWRSDRPWGNRLFLLQSPRIVVADSRQSAFMMFHFENGRLTPQGRSPDFEDRIAALLPVSLDNFEGMLIATVSSAESGQPRTLLQFFTHESFRLEKSAALPEAKFPDYESRLTFVANTAVDRPLGNWHHPYSPLVWENVFETLFQGQGDDQPQPALVSHFRADSSERIWELRLHTGLRFADSSSVTAEAVISGWQELWKTCLTNNCPSQWIWRDIAGLQNADSLGSTITGLQAVDDHNIRIVLDRPRPNFTEHLAHACMSVVKYGGVEEAPIGTGAFRVSEAGGNASHSRISCERNLFHHAGVAPLREIDFVFSEASPTEILLKYPSPGVSLRRKSDVQSFRQVGRMELLPFPKQALYFLALNSESGQLAEVAARWRIAEALDREIMARIVDEADCVSATTLFNLLGDEAVAPPGIASVRFDRPLSIIYCSQDGVGRQIAERLAARLSQLRIPSNQPHGLSPRSFESVRRSGKYELLIDSYEPVMSLPLYNLAALLHRGYAANPAIASLVETALSSNSADYATILEKLVLDQAILYPIVRTQASTALPAGLHDARPLGAGRIDFSKAWFPAAEARDAN